MWAKCSTYVSPALIEIPVPILIYRYRYREVRAADVQVYTVSFTYALLIECGFLTPKKAK